MVYPIPQCATALEGVIQALGFKPDRPEKRQIEEVREQIIDALREGEIAPGCHRELKKSGK